MLYIQFESAEDVSQFAKTAGLGLLESDMVETYEAAKEKDVICVFSFPDTPEIRLVLNRWRNRDHQNAPGGVS